MFTFSAMGTTMGFFSGTTAATARTAAKGLATASICKCDESALDIHDLGFFNNLLYLQTPDIDGSMKILYWRSMQMLTVWTLFVCVLGGTRLFVLR